MATTEATQLSELNLKSGSWLAVNCGDMPSESNCQLVIMAPEEQKQDLMDAAVRHGMDKHGEPDSAALRDGVESGLHQMSL